MGKGVKLFCFHKNSPKVEKRIIQEANSAFAGAPGIAAL
jgi:hypothetical protein